MYVFSFMPLGFCARVIVHVLHLPGVEVLSCWRDGAIFLLSNPGENSSSSSSLDPSAALVFLQYNPTVYTLNVRLRKRRTTWTGVQRSSRSSVKVISIGSRVRAAGDALFGVRGAGAAFTQKTAVPSSFSSGDHDQDHSVDRFSMLISTVEGVLEGHYRRTIGSDAVECSVPCTHCLSDPCVSTALLGECSGGLTGQQNKGVATIHVFHR